MVIRKKERRKVWHTEKTIRSLERRRRPESVKRIYLAEYPTSKFIYCTDPKCNVRCYKKAGNGLLRHICIAESINYSLPKGEILNKLQEKGIWVLDFFVSEEDNENHKKQWKEKRSIAVFERKVSDLKSMIGDLRKLEPRSIITAFKHHPTVKQMRNPRSWAFRKAVWMALERYTEVGKSIELVFCSPWSSIWKRHVRRMLNELEWM